MDSSREFNQFTSELDSRFLPSVRQDYAILLGSSILVWLSTAGKLISPRRLSQLTLSLNLKSQLSLPTLLEASQQTRVASGTVSNSSSSSSAFGLSLLSSLTWTDSGGTF